MSGDRLLAVLSRLDDAARAELLSALRPTIAARLRLAERNRLVMDLAERFFSAADSRAERAHAIALTLQRYAATAWRFDQRCAGCPHDPESLRAALWRLLCASNGRIISHERIRKIIAGHVHPVSMTSSESDLVG